MRLSEILAPKDILGGLKNPYLKLLDTLYTEVVEASNEFYVPLQLISSEIRDEFIEQFDILKSSLDYTLLDQDWKIKYDQLFRYFTS